MNTIRRAMMRRIQIRARPFFVIRNHIKASRRVELVELVAAGIARAACELALVAAEGAAGAAAWDGGAGVGILGLGDGAVVCPGEAVDFAEPTLRAAFSLLAGSLGVEAGGDVDAADGFDGRERGHF
jgi:hypothetical protein